MRLVDAEDLMLCITKEYNRRRTGDGLRLAWIEKAVNDAPTITPDMAQVLAYECGKAERKRGRWEMKPDPYGFFEEIPVCSECGCTTKWREKYPYCPNCGADMRKGETMSELKKCPFCGIKVIKEEEK